MVEVTFTPTAQDHVAVQRSIFRQQLRSRRFALRMAMLVAIALAVGVGFMLAMGERPVMAIMMGAIGAAGGLAGLAIIIGGTWLLIPRRARRLYAQQRTLHHEHRVTWTMEGMRQHSARADSFYPWVEFPGWHLSRDVMLVFVNDAMAYFLPRRAMTDEQLAQAEAILTAAGVPRRRSGCRVGGHRLHAAP